MARTKWIRMLCTCLVCMVMMLALVVVVAVCGGMIDMEGTDETEGGFVPSLSGETIDPGEWWSDMTRPPIEPDDTREPDSGSDESDTQSPWVSGMEWPTLSHEPVTDEPIEWPTLPDGWDTLPEEWGTLPDVGSLADWLAGMDGSLGSAAAGAASQLTVMTVHPDVTDTLYLKMQSFGDYTGQGWATAEPYTGLLWDECSADYLPGASMRSYGDAVEYSLVIDPLMPTRVIPYYLLVGGDSELQADDTRATGGTDGAYTLCYRPYGKVWASFVSGEVALFETRYRAYVYKQYRTIDDTTRAYLQQIIEEQGFDRNDPDIVEKVADYIRGAATYNLLYDRTLDSESNVAMAFLGGYREGVCRHFASAATLLYRALGIPARYTVGFCVDVTGGTTTAVKGADAHAWVEVYQNDFGWRYVEVTGAPSEQPDTRPELVLRPVTVAESYSEGKVLAAVHEITGFEAYLAEGYTYEVEVMGLQSTIGRGQSAITYLRLYDPSGADVTDSFRIQTEPGTLWLYRAELWFSHRSQSRVYNGEPLMTDASRCTLVQGTLPDTYRYRIIPIGSQTHVGTGIAYYRVVIECCEAVNGVDTWVDCTDEFLIHRTYGSLTVSAATITLKAADAVKTYDGTPLTAPDYTLVSGALASTDTIVSCTVEGAQTRVGRSENTITEVVIRNQDGEDVTRNYTIITEVGTLQVTAPPTDRDV